VEVVPASAGSANSVLHLNTTGNGVFTNPALTINLTGANVSGDLLNETATSLYNSGHLVIL
jgi:hypothetical protein